MQQVNVELGERSYPISIGAGLLNNSALFSCISKHQTVVIISNETVAPLYSEQLVTTLSQLDCTILQCPPLPDGEQYKTLDSFNLIMSFLLENNCGRDVMLIALGGGVIGDLVGFAAATYQRGVDFIQIPTTLLSQVDSSVGGKTAVNHPLGKNMIGAFYQPKAVIIDIDCLSTLPPRELAAGLAEVIKYGVILDANFFSWLEAHIEQLNDLDTKALIHTIATCCQIKADVVAQDEKESGIRAWLNLGHTFGHAIEAQMSYGNWLHGEAVAAGMRMAAYAAIENNTFALEDVRRLEAILSKAKLPINTPDSMSCDDFFTHMKRDKKALAAQVRLILPVGIGKAELVTVTDRHIIDTAIERCRINA